ncbi:response regulator [Candidatus Poribacteria bacterium]|nr:response regulator [Candidatus Poribacteria bacterium]
MRFFSKEMTILIVDDQENMCWILSKVLSEAGFSVEIANTAREAISIAEKVNLSAAVIDYRLPDKNGFDLLIELRKKYADLPSILITSYGSTRLKEKAEKIGFNSYFDKPFDNNSLIECLKKIINH